MKIQQKLLLLTFFLITQQLFVLNFKIICVTETWCKEDNILALFQLPHYSLIHHNRSSSKKGSGFCIFIHNSITYKTRSDLGINDENTESFCVELINKYSKNVLVCSIYRPPTGKIKPFKLCLKDIM